MSEQTEKPPPESATPGANAAPSDQLLPGAPLLDAIPDPAFAWAVPGGILSWNPAAEHLYGIPRHHALGRVGHDLLQTQFPDGMTRADFEAMLADRGEWAGELVHLTRDGRRIVVDSRLRVVSPPAGPGLAGGLVLEVNRDATRAKQAQSRARARARQQEALITLMGLAGAAVTPADLDAQVAQAVNLIADVLAVDVVLVYELTADGRTLRPRRRAGWDSAPHAGAAPHADADLDVDATPASHAGFALVAGEPVVLQAPGSQPRFALPDALRRQGVVSGVSVMIQGQPRPFGVLAAYTREPREFTPDEIHFLRAVANVIGVAVRDVQATQALRDGEARLRAIFDTAVDAIITIDERAIVDSINPAGCRLFGYAPDDVLGRNVSILMPQPYRDEHDGYMAAYLRTGVKRIIGIGREVVGQRKDGTTFPLDLAVSEFVVNGRRRFAGLIRDLTERRRLERQILDAGTEEQRRIGHDLHDGLCQQLTGLSFALEVLGQKLEKRDAPETPGIRKVADLVDQAITQARTLAHGLQPVTLEATGLVLALRELAAKAESMFHVACLFVGETDVLVHDNTVATHVYRIAQEAISNAVRHGKARTIVIDLGAAGRELRLSITDDGIGLAAASAANAAAGRAKGIGLDTMEYRARAIGGALSVRPGDRGGTVVTCTVPLIRDANP